MKTISAVIMLSSGLVSAGFAAFPALAEPHRLAVTAPDNSRILDDVFDCTSIVAADQRLACFDRNVGALKAAAGKKDIAVIDQAQVAKARRSLFGFNLPGLDLLSNGRKDQLEEEQSEIEAKIRSVSMAADGYWTVILEDGAVWHQTGGIIARKPQAGQAVVIRRGTLGSYFLRVDGQHGVRAKRES